jgi:hypothetical protein
MQALSMRPFSVLGCEPWRFIYAALSLWLQRQREFDQVIDLLLVKLTVWVAARRGL